MWRPITVCGNAPLRANHRAGLRRMSARSRLLVSTPSLKKAKSAQMTIPSRPTPVSTTSNESPGTTPPSTSPAVG